MKIKETSHQQQFLSWCERHNFYTSHGKYNKEKHYNGIIASIPNGGKRAAIDMTMLKREGLLAGAVDIFVMLPKGITLWLEFKTEGGRLSDEQKAFRDIAIMLGHKHYDVWSSFEAVSLVKGWIK